MKTIKEFIENDKELLDLDRNDPIFHSTVSLCLINHLDLEESLKLLLKTGYGSPVNGSKIEYLISEDQQVDGFDLFADRVFSLIERWKRFKKINKQYKSSIAIKSCLFEINDQFTACLMEDKDDNLKNA